MAEQQVFRVSDLIKDLKWFKQKYGNLPVWVTADGASEINNVGQGTTNTGKKICVLSYQAQTALRSEEDRSSPTQQEPQKKKTRGPTFRDVVRRYKSEFKFREELLKFFRFMFESPKLQGFMTWAKPGIPTEFKREKPNYWDRRRMCFDAVSAPWDRCGITQFVNPSYGNTVTDYSVVIHNGRCWYDALITPDEFTDNPRQWSPENGPLEHRKYQMELLLRRINGGNIVAANFLRYAIPRITPICELRGDLKEFAERLLHQPKGEQHE